MQDQETQGLTPRPDYKRIADQGYVWLDAKKALIGDPGNDKKKKVVGRELRKLAVVLDAERTS
jgi:hypothetical protein